MHFSLLDRVLESSPQKTVTLKAVSNAEEYLLDHFPTFPVLPGVMMLECMVQAARHHLQSHEQSISSPWVLGRVRALKYGKFVKPGAMLRIEVEPASNKDPSHRDFKAEAFLIEPGQTVDFPTACSGRITLRPARIG